MVKINELTVNNINGIENLDLKFNPHLNIICGENGIGKTTILNCIATSFNNNIKRLTQNVNHKSGNWEVIYSQNNNQSYQKFDIQHVANLPNHRNDSIQSNKFINFFVDRTNNRSLNNQIANLQQWFFNNYYLESYISNKKLHNLIDVKEIFSLLNPNIKYSRCIEANKYNNNYMNLNYINKNRNENNINILLETPSGEIPLEYFSSGYLSCWIILLRIIKRIEYNSNMIVESFDGLVIIDEVDLHLHPEWQAKLINILKKLLPNAQLIVTTHSPHIIQVAKAEEVIALTGKQNYPKVNKLLGNNQYGFQGWTIEEILRDVMGLNNTYSNLYKNYSNKFEKALNNNNKKDAIKYFNRLSEMLHPNNPLGKILSIQMGALGDFKND